jgi:flagellar basal body-associated protein FliL
MKRLILIAVVLLLLVAAGGGGYYYFVLKGAEAAAAAEAEPEPEPVYVEFNPLLLPIVRNGEVEQVISVVVALEMVDQAAADQAVALSPRLNDAYMQALYGTLYAEDVIVDGVVDLRAIKRELVIESNIVLGDGLVRDALVQMVSQRHL